MLHWKGGTLTEGLVVISNEGGKRNQAAIRLVAVSDMVNQAVGDALSGILMVETVLQYRNWSLQQWNAMYTDLPSRQLKVTDYAARNLFSTHFMFTFNLVSYVNVQVKVADRSVFKTTDAETKVAFPSLLQAAIDAAVGEYLLKLSKVVMQSFLSPTRTNQIVPIS